MNNEELVVRQKIMAYIEGKSSVLSTVTDRLSSPLKWAFNNVVPDTVNTTLTNAFEEGLLKVNDLSQFTFTRNSILAPFAEKDHSPKSLAEIRQLPLALCDEIAEKYIHSNKIISALEGGGLGLGGLLLLAADIPAVMSINFRMLSQIANTFGYNTREEADRIYLLNIFHLAGATDSKDRRAALRRLQEIAKETHSASKTGYLGSYSMTKMVQELAEKLVLRLAHRKLGQMIPIIGAGIGAGMNYHFTLENGYAAITAFRQRRLDESEQPLLEAPKQTPTMLPE